MTLIEIARLFLYIRERQGVANRGLRVEAIQHWAGGSSGDSWCMEMLWVWLDLYTQGNTPFGREQVCEDLHILAQHKGWLIEEPEIKIEDIHGPHCCIAVLSINPANGKAHHVALLTGLFPMQAIAGNTSSDGKSVNGDRVAEHDISPVGKVFVRIPL